jgi:ABC-type multidrug transport system ATPase subunit
VRVELKGVTKRFGAVRALRDVSFELPPGGRCALIGPNGAGKSTLTRIVMGMLAHDGEVLVDGRSPFTDRAQLAQRMAYVPRWRASSASTSGSFAAARCAI